MVFGKDRGKVLDGQAVEMRKIHLLFEDHCEVS